MAHTDLAAEVQTMLKTKEHLDLMCRFGLVSSTRRDRIVNNMREWILGQRSEWRERSKGESP